jgi:hypothetical protein
MGQNYLNSSIIMILLLLLTTIITVQTATASATLSPGAQQIVDDVVAYCEQVISEPLHGECIGVAHESPTLVVLGGKLLLNPFEGATTPYDNIFIWQAVDGFIALGYSIDSVQLTGQGTTENPHNIMIVMSKIGD